MLRPCAPYGAHWRRLKQSKVSGYKGILKVWPKDAMSRGGVVKYFFEMTLSCGFCPISYLSASAASLKLDAVFIRLLKDYAVNRFMGSGLVNSSQARTFKLKKQIRRAAGISSLVLWLVTREK